MLAAFNLSQQTGARVLSGPCITIMIPPEAGYKAQIHLHQKIRNYKKQVEKILVRDYPTMAADILFRLSNLMDTIADSAASKSIVIMMGGDVSKIYYLDITVQEWVLVADHWSTWCWIQADRSPLKMILLKGSIIYQIPVGSFTEPLFAIN